MSRAAEERSQSTEERTRNAEEGWMLNVEPLKISKSPRILTVAHPASSVNEKHICIPISQMGLRVQTYILYKGNGPFVFGIARGPISVGLGSLYTGDKGSLTW